MRHTAEVNELRRATRQARWVAYDLSPEEIDAVELLLRDALAAITVEKWARSKEEIEQFINPEL